MRAAILPFIFAGACFLAGCGDTGATGTGAGRAPVIKGHSEAAFRESIEDIRATLTTAEAERFQGILLERQFKGHGRAQLAGMTAADFFSQAEAEAAAKAIRDAKFEALLAEMKGLADLNLPDAEHNRRLAAIKDQMRALGIPITD